MTTTNSQTKDAAREPAQKPDWIAKAAKGYGRKSRLECIGAAWNREDGGVCLRLVGTQIVDGDIYLYPAQSEPGEPAAER